VRQSLRVILPAFLESETICAAINRLIVELDQSCVDFEIVVVIDGPDDQTRNVLRAIEDSRVSVRELSVNSGKGAALRAGCISSTSEFTAFIDADLDIHPTSLMNCIETLTRSNDPLVVCAYGSKFHPKSQVQYPTTRRIGSYIFRWLIRGLFQIQCNDTQTGVKVFRTVPLLEALAFTREERFLFDVELLVVLWKLNYRFIEAPVKLDFQYSSTINPNAIVKMFTDLFGLYLRLKSSFRLIGTK